MLALQAFLRPRSEITEIVTVLHCKVVVSARLSGAGSHFFFILLRQGSRVQAHWYADKKRLKPQKLVENLLLMYRGDPKQADYGNEMYFLFIDIQWTNRFNNDKKK